MGHEPDGVHRVTMKAAPELVVNAAQAIFSRVKPSFSCAPWSRERWLIIQDKAQLQGPGKLGGPTKTAVDRIVLLKQDEPIAWSATSRGGGFGRFAAGSSPRVCRWPMTGRRGPVPGIWSAGSCGKTGLGPGAAGEIRAGRPGLTGGNRCRRGTVQAGSQTHAQGPAARPVKAVTTAPYKWRRGRVVLPGRP